MNTLQAIVAGSSGVIMLSFLVNEFRMYRQRRAAHRRGGYII